MRHSCYWTALKPPSAAPADGPALELLGRGVELVDQRLRPGVVLLRERQVRRRAVPGEEPRPRAQGDSSRED